jgi:hypothetical protein
MNTSLGAGWNIEISSFPPGTVGFYVNGSRAAPQYLAFTQSGELFRRDQNNWTSIAKGLVSSSNSIAGFGPAFVNPYDRSIVYALGQNAVLRSTQGGDNFITDGGLTALVAGPNNLPMSTLAHMAFNRANPSQVVAGARSGLFYSSGDGKWADLTALMPLPRSSITSVAIDCEAVYASLDARSLIRITGYKGAIFG